MNAPLSRRFLLAGSGALVVAFSLHRPALAEDASAPPPPALPGSLKQTSLLDAWIRVGADGLVSVFTGKAELGQGLTTALIQLAAEELDVAPSHINLVTADTSRTPNEGFTAGSHSMQDSGTAIQNAAAQVRALLVDEASRQWGVPAAQLHTADGEVLAGDGRQLSYGALAAALSLHVSASPANMRKNPAAYRLVGTNFPRIDIPAKIAGGASYVQDIRLPGMVHARAIRQPSYGAKLRQVDAGPIAAMPGVIQVVQEGSYLAVVATREWQAVQAMRALAAAAQWDEVARLPPQDDIHPVLLALPSRDIEVLRWQNNAAPATQRFAARYTRPYLSHGSIGPSCAVGLFEHGRLTVWTHTQGVYPLRHALAEMMGLPDAQVRCIHTEGSGCYGQNGADDVAGDAALIARAVPGRPVRVQWMRDQEQMWEPFGPAMITEITASLDAEGRIVDWNHAVWSNTHSRRPDQGGLMLQNDVLPAPLPVPPPMPIPMPEGGGDRNSNPIYSFPNAHVVYHFIPDMPIRVSAMRGLGAYLNVFTIESAMDELARLAQADTVAFRLRHLPDPRARDVITTAAQRFDWPGWQKQGRGHGRGFAFARYKNLGAFCAIALDLRVDHETGQIQIGRVVAAVDSGQPVNPDGIRNQIEGAILQSASWTLYEQVTFSRQRITSDDWSGYPILRFPAAPQSVEVFVINRPGQPFLGTGEAGQGPMAAAIANALEDAVGVRLRNLPLSATRVKAAIGV